MRATAVLLAATTGLGALLFPGVPSHAETRHAAMIIDANSGKVLYEQFADAPRRPASLTKMMTLYLVFEAIEQGRLSYASKIKVSAKAAAVAPSKLDLEPGDEIALIDAIKALITKSANDMAVAVAEEIGGSEAGFVRIMNERARLIGMRATTFTNASGLPDSRQVTTARDMLTLALRLEDDYPRHFPLFALRSFSFRGKTYRTHNTLLHAFPGMDGIKTGYTRASGFNLVSSVKVDKKHLVGAVFGGVTANARNAHMRMQLFRALEKASTVRTRRAAPQLVARATPAARRPAREANKVDERTPEMKPAKVASAAPAREPPPVAPTPGRAAGSATNAPPSPAPEAASKAASTPDIAVLKVRPVAIAPQEVPAQAAPQGAATVMPKLDLRALREAISSESAAGTHGAAASPSGLPPANIEDLISSSHPRPDHAPFEQKVALAGEAGRPPPPQPGMGLGRPPSTLEEQASLLTAPRQELRPALKPSAYEQPQRFAAAPAGGGYEIQIGAYSTAEEAENRMAAARSRTAGLLDGHRSMALPVQKADRQIFRARFAGFDENSAANACLELRRLAIDCFVMKAD